MFFLNFIKYLSNHHYPKFVQELNLLIILKFYFQFILIIFYQQIILRLFDLFFLKLMAFHVT